MDRRCLFVGRHALFPEIRGGEHGRGGFASPCGCRARFGFVEPPYFEPVGTEFMVTKWFVVGFELFDHLVIGAGHVEDGFAVADGLGVEGEARVPTHELHDVPRGVRPDAREGDEELEDLIVCAGAFEPVVVNLAGIKDFGKVDDALVAVANPTSPTECPDSGAGKFLC